MPTISTFHNKYWKAKANAPPPPPTGGAVQGYPTVQSAVIVIAIGAA